MSSHPCREILGNGLDERTVLSCKFNRSAGTADDHYPIWVRVAMQLEIPLAHDSGITNIMNIRFHCAYSHEYSFSFLYDSESEDFGGNVRGRQTHIQRKLIIKLFC